MKRFNGDEFLWFTVLILLDLSIIYLVFSGKIDFYIGKKMIKYNYITIVMISIVTIFQFNNIFTSIPNYNIKIKLLPIIVTLILGGISTYTQETFKHAELNKTLKESKTSRIEMQYLYEHESDYNSIIEENNINERIKTNLDDQINIIPNNKQEILVINEKNPMILDDIRVNPEKYLGKNLEIHGFVCKESYLNKNQFLIGRIVMTCCAADSKIVGIIGQYDNAYDLYENQNIVVKGTIGSSTIKDHKNIEHRVIIIIINNLEVENSSNIKGNNY